MDLLKKIVNDKENRNDASVHKSFLEMHEQVESSLFVKSFIEKFYSIVDKNN